MNFVDEWEQIFDTTKTTWLRADVRGGLYAECWQWHGDTHWNTVVKDENAGTHDNLEAAKSACDAKLRELGYLLEDDEG